MPEARAGRRRQQRANGAALGQQPCDLIGREAAHGILQLQRQEWAVVVA